MKRRIDVVVILEMKYKQMKRKRAQYQYQYRIGGGTLDVYYHSILMENTRSPSLAPLDALIRFISALWRLSNKQPVLFIVSHEREKKSHTEKGANKQWFWANVQFYFVLYGLAVALW